MERLKNRKLKIDIVSYFVVLMTITITIISTINFRESKNNTFVLTGKIFEKSFLFASTKIGNLFADAEDSGSMLVDYVAPKMEQLETSKPSEFSQFARALEINPYLLSIYVAKSDDHFVQMRRVPAARLYQHAQRGELPANATYIWRSVAPNSKTENWSYLSKDLRVIDEEQVKVTSTSNPTERDWYSSAVYKKAKSWSDVYIFKTSQTPGLTLSFPIKETYSPNKNTNKGLDKDADKDVDTDTDKDKNKDAPKNTREHLGVLAMDMTVDSANSFLNTIKISENSSIIVLNDAKKIIASTQNATVEQPTKAPSLAIKSTTIENTKAKLKDTSSSKKSVTKETLVADAKKEATEDKENLPEPKLTAVQVKTIDTISDPIAKYSYYNSFLDNKHINIFTIDNVDYISYTHSFGAKDRKLYFSMHAPISDFLYEVQRANQKSLLITLAISIAAMIILYIFARKISDPIARLAEDARKISQLDFPGTSVCKTNIREIQDLSNSMNTLNHSIGMFSKYIPKDLALKLLEKDGDITIGGSNQTITALFSDIEGFTTISEDVPAEYLVLHLSEYFEGLTNIIINNKGSIDKYIGDAIMALWGAPYADENQVPNACRAALLCQHKLTELNEGWVKLGKPALKTRIGLHTGDAIVGNIGSSDRINFTALGDSINLAARLEGLNKYYNTSIMVSQSIYEIAHSQFLFRILDKVSVKGKNKSILVYELVCETAQNSPDYMKHVQYSVRAGEAFEAYLARDWEKAIEFYTRMQKEFVWGRVANELIINRCLNYIQTPPSDSWQGEYQMTEK